MEPARAGWSFNKWRKTKKLRRYQRLMRRHRNVHERAVALEVEAAPAVVVVVAAVDVAALAAVELVVAVAPGTGRRWRPGGGGARAKAVTRGRGRREGLDRDGGPVTGQRARRDVIAINRVAKS